jgi:cell division protein FtsW
MKVGHIQTRRSLRNPRNPGDSNPAFGANSMDGGIIAAAALLIGIGVVMSYSTTATLALDASIPPLFLHHVSALVLGIGLAALCAFVPTEMLRRIALPLWGVSVLFLFATALFGVEVNGAQRWLPLPSLGFRFQPAEIAKCATVLAVASVIARRDGHDELSVRRTLFAGALALPPIILLLGQPDLGNAVLLGCLVALLLVVAGTRLAHLIVPGLIAVAGIVLYIVSHDYARRRITGFMDPWERPLDEGFQLVQSFVAFGRGGLLGVGLGNGQQKLAYLPEAHTDFILSLVAEEAGLIGVFAVLGGFAALLIAGTRVAARARDRFELLVGFGMTALLTLPALINASVVMGLLPTKGLTLPFLSYGRTSLVVSCIALGLLLGVARSTAAEDAPNRGRRTWH